MKVSYNWLKQYVDVACDIAELAEKMTMAGIEVEAIENNNLIPDGVVIGEIRKRSPHPNADKLSICEVFDGNSELQIVCGAPNCDAGKKVPLATIGTVFTDSETGESFKIKKGKLRGEKSFGMLCSATELGLGSDNSGLLELDTELPAGTPVDKLYPGDTVFDVEITPNRPDWLSHWGIARDVACLFDTTAKLPTIPEKMDAEQLAPTDLVTVEDKALCPRYTARIIRNVKISESPEWLKERLLSIGLRPINNVVDITNFVLHELGQPLHTFDLNKLADGKIVVRHANENEKLTLLDNSELELAPHHLVIADTQKALCLAGVMGGIDSGVTEATTDILLESAAFCPSSIRKTSRELGVSSDSSYRFERGIDWNMVEKASLRATELIEALTGGKVSSNLVDVQGEQPKTPELTCRFEKICKLIGVEISSDKIIEIFKQLGLEVSNISATECTIVAPSYRLDITREADLSEEVARIHGLDKIPVIPVTGKQTAPFAKDTYAKLEELQNQLISLGLYQCLHYSMVSKTSALQDSRFAESDLVEISNPLSLDLAYMRPSLFGEMLETVERNVARKNNTFRLFEMGSVFCANPELFPEERHEICIMLSGQRFGERFSEEKALTYDFYDLKGIIEALFELRGLGELSFKAVNDKRFAPGYGAAIVLNNNTIGHLGQLAKQFTTNLRTSYPIFAAQLDVNALFNAKQSSLFYNPVGQYPSTTRDIAFVADKTLEHQKVIDFIKSAKVKNLEKIELFDIFTNEDMDAKGKKSMAYTLLFKSNARTLTDKEVNAAFEKLRNKMAKQLDIELR